ncbi:MAG: MerR family transcriptional regulator [Burkholderiaceae bacterium]
MTGGPERAVLELAPAGNGAPMAGIAAVERATGISKDMLRIWERRYGFPQPLRDAAGERVYPDEQVQRLRLLKRLLDAGYRPGRVVPADAVALQAMLGEHPAAGRAGARATGATATAGPAAAGGAEPSPALAELERCLELLRAHDVAGLRGLLSQGVMRLGLAAAVLNLIAPLTTQVGELWMRGSLQVFEEHMYSESLQQVLRQAIQAVPAPALSERPRVLLTTLPGEQHGLGLLMVEALMTLEGCQCLSLGVQTPVEELPRAAAAQRADIVALSFSGYLATPTVLRALAQLRGLLPAATELWVGGSAAALRRRSRLDGLQHVTALSGIAPALARWRAARTAPE